MNEASEGTEYPDLPPGMAVYYLVLLVKGPAWTAEESPELERLSAAHLAHLHELYESGRLILVGPLLDDGLIRGISVFRVGSAAEARALAEADPAVQAGRFVAELHPWMAQQGIRVAPQST